MIMEEQKLEGLRLYPATIVLDQRRNKHSATKTLSSEAFTEMFDEFLCREAVKRCDNEKDMVV